MNNENAIEILKSQLSDFRSILGRQCGIARIKTVEKIKATVLTIETLEKQNLKEPIFEGDGYGDNGEIILDIWICPNCDAHYEVDYDVYDYCPKCGQAIDWSEK